MKIGIITFTYGCNYGQRLQNFAMQEILKKYADAVYTIPQMRCDSLLRRILRNIKNYFVNHRSFLIRSKREKSFKKFDKRYINYYVKRIGENHVDQRMVKQFDYFVCGSDQIWSPYTKDVNSSMFLRFAPREKRICYAPSIAAESIPKEKISRYIDYWKGFEFLSVREANLIDYIKNVTGKEVTLVADPTLLLQQEQWVEMEKKPELIKNKGYAVFYFLGSNKKANNIKEYLLKQGIAIVDMMNDELYFKLGPNEFLYLIHHARVVVTDSYHGVLFSIIYHTPFVIFEREEVAVNMNSRFDTLNMLFNIKRRMINEITDAELLQMDFEDIDSILEKIKKESFNYLDRCFNKNYFDIN